MKRTENGEKKATRQCWECLKRRLVCDHTLPHCKKCIKAGKECPGYDEQKPLQWVEPGKVTSRRRKKDIPSKVYSIRSKDQKIVSPPDCNKSGLLDTTTADYDLPLSLVPDPDAPQIRQEDIDFHKCQLAFALLKVENKTWSNSRTSDEREEHLTKTASNHAAGANVADRILKLGGRRKIEAVLRRGDAWEATLLLGTAREPLERLRRLLWFMETHDLPIYDYLSNDTCEVVQAVEYFNTRMYPDTKKTDALAPNPAMIVFPVYALHLLPPAVHHTLVCVGVNHFIHSLPPGADRAIIASNRSKVYKHHGLAIRALSEFVAKDKTRSSDLTITSILMFMAMEVQNFCSDDWISHVHGMKRLIDMRGGFEALVQESPYLVSTLVSFVIIVTFSNSLGPPSEQINITEPLEKLVKEVETLYGLIFPHVLYPPTLYMEIIRINRLRQDITTSPFEDASHHTLEAFDILTRIEDFVPEDWAQPGEHYNEWLLIGTMYQSAIALYCTMSLQSVAAFPNTFEMDSMRSVHGVRLLKSLEPSVYSTQLGKFSLFPLCVLGVEAGYRPNQSTRYWIEKRLEEHSRLLGTNSSLKARAVLQRYWKRGEPGWDECFDRPYVFIL